MRLGEARPEAGDEWGAAMDTGLGHSMHRARFSPSTFQQPHGAMVGIYIFWSIFIGIYYFSYFPLSPNFNYLLYPFVLCVF